MSKKNTFINWYEYLFFKTYTFMQTPRTKNAGLQFRGAVMISPAIKTVALSLNSQLKVGEGFEIESVVGYSHTFSWDTVENTVSRASRMGY